jgi:hypothetical protein
VEGRAVEAAFDAGLVTSDAGALLLGAADRAIDLVGRFAECFRDQRRQDLIEHTVALLAPRPWIAGRFCPHPPRLARLVAQQSVEKLPRRGRDPLLRKQRTNALLGISQRLSPQRQRIFNRRTTNHQIPNHGHHGFRTSNQMQL